VFRIKKGLVHLDLLPTGCYTIMSNGAKDEGASGYWPRYEVGHDCRSRKYNTSPKKKRNGSPNLWSTSYHWGWRSFCVRRGEKLNVVLAINPRLTDSQVRIVLTWNALPADLDLHISFMSTDKLCDVGYPKATCESCTLEVQNSNGGDSGCEAVTIPVLKKTTYQVAVQKYAGQPATPTLYNSGAQVDVYVKSGPWPLIIFPITGTSQDNDLKGTNTWWNVFCIDGSKNTVLNRLQPLQYTTATRPAYSTNCTKPIGART